MMAVGLAVGANGVEIDVQLGQSPLHGHPFGRFLSCGHHHPSAGSSMRVLNHSRYFPSSSSKISLLTPMYARPNSSAARPNSPNSKQHCAKRRCRRLEQSKMHITHIRSELNSPVSLWRESQFFPVFSRGSTQQRRQRTACGLSVYRPGLYTPVRMRARTGITINRTVSP